VLANCIYEVHFCKSRFGSSLYGEEFVFVANDGKPEGYAVTVTRPSNDLHSLLIREGSILTQEKSLYILEQIAEIWKKFKDASVCHNNLTERAIYVDMLTFEV
jgi:hypothetical protein